MLTQPIPLDECWDILENPKDKDISEVLLSVLYWKEQLNHQIKSQEICSK